MPQPWYRSGVLQNIPAFTIIACALAGVGVVPWAVHRLYYGEGRKVGRDEWDWAMDKRDDRLIRERTKRLIDLKKMEQERAEMEKVIAELAAAEEADH